MHRKKKEKNENSSPPEGGPFNNVASMSKARKKPRWTFVPPRHVVNVAWHWCGLLHVGCEQYLIVSLQNQGCWRLVTFGAERPGLHSSNKDDLQLWKCFPPRLTGGANAYDSTPYVEAATAATVNNSKEVRGERNSPDSLIKSLNFVSNWNKGNLIYLSVGVNEEF